MGFFTLLAFAPFPLDMTASQVGWIFFGWGLLLAITSVWVAPILQRHVPGARGLAHPVIADAGHFLQEDAGPRLGQIVTSFVQADRRRTPSGGEPG